MPYTLNEALSTSLNEDTDPMLTISNDLRTITPSGPFLFGVYNDTNVHTFQNPQICDPDGTEEFVTENGVPVGHVTKYPYDMKTQVERLIDVPDVPSTNGTYVLKATRSSSGLTYTWVTG